MLDVHDRLDGDTRPTPVQNRIQNRHQTPSQTVTSEADRTVDRTTTQVLDLALRIGELLLSSGAGAADVTATMQSVAIHYGVRQPEIDVTFTSLSMSTQPDPYVAPIVVMRQVKQRDIDYADLTSVDVLVSDILLGRVEPDEARSRLARITSTGHTTRRGVVSLAWGLMSAGIALQLGGDLPVLGIAFVAAIGIDRLQLAMARRRLPYFYQQVAGGAFASTLAITAASLSDEIDPSLVVTANIVMLLAGIGFMGALQDALSGFYITAGARITEALLATAGIIVGVSAGLTVTEVVGLAPERLIPGRTSLEELVLTAPGAAIGAAAFAVACYAPWRVIAPIGVIAAVAFGVNQAVFEASSSRPLATGVGAFVIGLVAFGVAGRVRVPPLVVAVPAVIPLLPGLSIYRGLSLLTEDSQMVSSGLLSMITAITIALAIASAVILGEYIAQPLKREARRLESRLSGPRLVGPFRARSVRADYRPDQRPDQRSEDEPGAPNTGGS
ncbi:threonine/serine exporter ThrE family protein [Nocardioides sp. CFH 31398]|uniref:threonine/serine ThrE exporter family protein n=1 Tax=Nocardioides sp. CFH 31398 TaxID=2919579 RepID=UPI001F052322|nr:threonine/serine exporter family protein [Nocardioides sp. CFH 31398]MCH1867626.1 threonine/serine exporter family protein [Nocardioides sp. CFH 31398]